MKEEDIMNRRTFSVPDWNASMLEIGDDMGVDDDGTRWVVEKVSEAYMTTDGRSWVQHHADRGARAEGLGGGRRMSRRDAVWLSGDDRRSLQFPLQWTKASRRSSFQLGDASLLRAGRVTIHVTKIQPTQIYPAAPTVSPAAHSACPHSQALDRWLMATISQYSLQYLLSFAAGHSQPGWAHLSAFSSAMAHLPAFQVPPPRVGGNGLGVI
jgi:hypothetical protein